MNLIIQVEVEVDRGLTDWEARDITQNVDTAIAQAVEAGRILPDPGARQPVPIQLVKVTVWKPAQPLS